MISEREQQEEGREEEEGQDEPKKVKQPMTINLITPKKL